MKNLLWLAATLIALFVVGSSGSQGAEKFAAPMQMALLGGVAPSAEELVAMQKGSYLLHARDGKLTKVPAEKSQLPHDPKGHAQVTYTAMSRDGVVYVNQGSLMCKSTDGGKTWTSYPREWGEVGGKGTFHILNDGTFVSVWSKEEGPAEVVTSRDEGRSWTKISEIPTEVPGYTFIGRGMPIYRLPDDTLLWFGRWDLTPDTGPGWYSMTFMCRSEDGGLTWSDLYECHEHVFEGGMTQLPSGRLFASLRYQRPPRPEDPEDIHTIARGGSPVYNPRSPYKHVLSVGIPRSGPHLDQLSATDNECYGFPVAFRDGTVVMVRTNGYNRIRSGVAMISHDEGATWEDEAYYVYAPGVTTIKGNIGYSQSVLIEGELILTIAGTTDTAGRNSWAANIGNCDLTAIRWRPPRNE